jgi:very-short-patch-repair endonuclease
MTIFNLSRPLHQRPQVSKPKVYLAGKIGVRDWRWNVGGYSDNYANPKFNGAKLEHTRQWPVLTGGPLDITGPFFVAGEGHDGMHGPEQHGTGANNEGYDNCLGQALTAKLCRDAIDRSDLFYAWIDTLDTHGTLVEIGYAVAQGIPVVIAMPACDCPPEAFENWLAEHQCPSGQVWFAGAFANLANGHCITAADPLTGLVKALELWKDTHIQFDSPVERIFWAAYRAGLETDLPGLVPQHQVGAYRVDFAIPDRKLAIEIDGLAYHGSQEAFIKDRNRQRDLEMAGWRVLRFAAKEVSADAAGCVRKAAQWAAGVAT